MTGRPILYDKTRHAAARTDDYVFHQLIPYIGNKRKLLDLIHDALSATGTVGQGIFLDLFAGSGVVSRFAKRLGYQTIANDWEPYARAINTAYVQCNAPPLFDRLGGYDAAIALLNSLPPRVDWVTEHLCPADDERYDVAQERLFFMRKNGMRIDTIRHQIQQWRKAEAISDIEEACLLAPLLYQTCYTSNTSGVFKGFHNGWGGQTGTALYRIAGDLRLSPCVFHDNHKENQVLCEDAIQAARRLADQEVAVAYLDPPYNQHPYGSNYHLLNSVALWDKPSLPKRITLGSKAAIRTDWRTRRRSAYNHREEAGTAYATLLGMLNAHFVLTSYSTDGTIPLRRLLEANTERGRVTLTLRGYKRYRVSSQRFSAKPMNVEIVILADTHRRSRTSVDELEARIRRVERAVLEMHPESRTKGRKEQCLCVPNPSLSA